MKLAILAIGRMKSGPERELLDRFVDRTRKSGKPLKLDGPELVEFVESRAGQTAKRKDEEGQCLLDAAGKSGRVWVLDECGKDLTSAQFAKMIAYERDNGTARLCFALGGPDGHGARLKEAANATIRFGTMTWPHQIARILLAEQLYRATTILSGHPYHRV